MCLPRNLVIYRVMLMVAFEVVWSAKKDSILRVWHLRCASNHHLCRASIFALHSHLGMSRLDLRLYRLDTQGKLLDVVSFLISLFRCPTEDQTH